MRGSAVEEQRLTLPYEYALELDPDEAPSFIDFYDAKKLMSKRLFECLRAAGVDNLQTFPAIITEERTGKRIEDFVKFNVVGSVSCVDEARSRGRALADVKVFEKLVIDPARTRGLKLFRLAESRMDIIVSQDVFDAIGAGGFTGIEFQPVEPDQGGDR